MGAYVALQLVLRCPGAITHLVLVAATGGVDVASHSAVDWRGDYLATAWMIVTAWRGTRSWLAQ
jgi:pimeloyl-ACP methyl ester carboxylesterase